MVVFLEDCRKKYLNEEGNASWDAVQARWDELKNVKISLANKFFTNNVRSAVE
jgi:arginine kinase